MKTKLFESLRFAFPRFLFGAVGVGCSLGPIILLNASGATSLELTAALVFLLLLCYAVVFVICLCAKWDLLKRLLSNTMLAMGFMIIGLLINELTGIFIEIKHKLVIVYAFLGFFMAELIKPKARTKALDEFKRKRTAKPIKPATEDEDSQERSSADLIAERDELAKEIAALSRELVENQRLVAGYEKEQRRLVSVENENQLLQGKIDNFSNQLGISENELREVTDRLQESVEFSATLRSEIARFKQELREKETAIEMLQSAAQRAAILQSENQNLYGDNQRLQELLKNQRIALDASQTRLQEAAHRNQEISDRYERLEAEVADHRRQLDNNQSKAPELESAQQQLANAESREMIHRDQQKQLEALIVNLECQLSEGKQQIQALDMTNQRLRETDRAFQELAEENRRLLEEVSLWRERHAASEESRRQMSTLRRRGWSAAKVYEQMPSATAILERKSPNNDPLETEGDRALLPTGDSAAEFHIETEYKVNWVDRTSVQWRFGAVAAAVLLIAGVVTTGVLGTRFAAPKDGAVTPGSSFQEFPASKEEPVVSENSFQEYKVEAVAKPERKPERTPALRLRGTFATVRPTQVYTGPSENSALIADIGAGTKLNVVDSRFGWLEIRSRQGRPPGFVRQEATVRIAQN